MEIEQLFNKLIEEKLGKDFGEKVETTLCRIVQGDANKTNEEIKKELCDDIIKQYRTLFNLLHVKTPCTLKISADDLTTFVIDEKAYDLSIYFSHDDLQATECIMAIEALFCDLRSVSEDLDHDIRYIETHPFAK